LPLSSSDISNARGYGSVIKEVRIKSPSALILVGDAPRIVEWGDLE
jgi:hypothetical protein